MATDGGSVCEPNLESTNRELDRWKYARCLGALMGRMG